MKIRNGFVSNSSSSSFLVLKKDYTILELAKDMLEVAEKDSLYKEIKKKFPAIQRKYPKIGLSFDTINYRTFICELKDHLAVQTNNNNHWWDYINIINPNQDIIEELLSIGPNWYEITRSKLTDSVIEDMSMNLSRNSLYWYSEYDIVGREPTHDEEDTLYKVTRKQAPNRCEFQEHSYQSDRILLENGEIVCAICYVNKREK